MAISKKGTWVGAEMTHWFVYIPMTVIVIFVLAIIPARLADNSLQPILLDATTTKDVLFQRMNYYDFPYGTDYNKLRELDASRNLLSLSNKMFAYKVTTPTNVFYGNNDFYERAKPLAGAKYKIFTTSRWFGDERVDVELIYPEEYDAFS